MPPSPRSLCASAALLAVYSPTTARSPHRRPLARLVAGLVRAIARESWHDLRLTCACVSSCVRRYAAGRAVCRWSGVRSVGAWSRCCCAPVSVSLVGRARDFSRRVCQHCRLLWVPNASIHSLVTSLSFRHADATRKGANSARSTAGPRRRRAPQRSTAVTSVILDSGLSLLLYSLYTILTTLNWLQYWYNCLRCSRDSCVHR